MPDGIEFPTLPIIPKIFNEEDTARLKELEALRTQMSQVYQTKFSPEAWAKVNPMEKLSREMLVRFAPVIKPAIPWQWGWDYGLTPEQNQQYTIKVETEYKELVRKQKVDELTPAIQEGIKQLALVGTPITDSSTLNQTFKSIGLYFNEEEIANIVAYADAVSKMTKEDLLTIGTPQADNRDCWMNGY